MRKSAVRILSKSVGTVLFTDRDDYVGITTGFVAYRDGIILSTHHDGGPFTKPIAFITPEEKAYRIARYYSPDGHNSVYILETYRRTGLTPFQCAEKVDARQGDHLTAIGYKDGSIPVITDAVFHRYALFQRDVNIYGSFTYGSCGTPILNDEGKVISVFHGSSKRRKGYNISTSIEDYNDCYRALMEDAFLWDGECSLRTLLSKI